MAFALPSLILAASTATGGLSLAQVEDAYWDCEFAAIHGVIDLDGAATCGEIYERLKADKFLGDFNRFLVWWQKNKERELSSRKRQLQRSR